MKPELKTLLPALVVVALLLFAVSYQQSQQSQESQESQESEDSVPNAATADSVIESRVVPSQRPAGEQQAGSESASGSSSNLPGSGVDASGAPVAGRNSTGQRLDSSEPVLSDRVFYVIQEAQQRQLEDQWEESLAELNALYSDFDSMTPFEQATLLNFYTNVLVRLEMWQESISAFSLLLTVEDLRPDINSRALMALGQLHASVDEVSTAIAYYQEWLEFTRGMTGLEAQTAIVEQQLQSLTGR
ncbi:hypothetical protein [Pseudohongiella sp.]|uniref:Tetratricopeptide repeat protein n=1 Tax=marine sediment metagenome TaxID=412755 RepID=A0A0F9VJZ4_9ZZZZ|nr:hypothetical protein [Pseudohongiella sp.]HDZ10368.1 hypothetical protein [Pseudohongiella sp.]HEA62009.1 hypothetical protein [Pseudohongiella sp.]